MTDEQIATIKLKCMEVAIELYKCDQTARSKEDIADDLFKWVTRKNNDFQTQVDKHAADFIKNNNA